MRMVGNETEDGRNEDGGEMKTEDGRNEMVGMETEDGRNEDGRK